MVKGGLIHCLSWKPYWWWSEHGSVRLYSHRLTLSHLDILVKLNWSSCREKHSISTRHEIKSFFWIWWAVVLQEFESLLDLFLYGFSGEMSNEFVFVLDVVLLARFVNCLPTSHWCGQIMRTPYWYFFGYGSDILNNLSEDNMRHSHVVKMQDNWALVMALIILVDLNIQQLERITILLELIHDRLV